MCLQASNDLSQLNILSNDENIVNMQMFRRKVERRNIQVELIDSPDEVLYTDVHPFQDVKSYVKVDPVIEMVSKYYFFSSLVSKL